MSYTIVKDEGHLDHVLQIRATISTRAELEQLIAKLNHRLDTDFAQEENHERPAEQSIRPSAALPAPTSARTQID